MALHYHVHAPFQSLIFLHYRVHKFFHETWQDPLRDLLPCSNDYLRHEQFLHDKNGKKKRP